MARRSGKKVNSQVNLTVPEEGPLSPHSAMIGQFLAGPWMPWIVAAIAFLIYLPSLHSDFVSDARLEINEGFVTSLSNLPKVMSLRVLGMHLMLADRPGEMLWLMLNAALWGKSPFGFHLGSVLLHAINVSLLLILLRRLVEPELAGLNPAGMLRARFALVAATLIFAVHPIATESVAEVSFSSALLVTFFTLAGLLAGTAFHPEQRKAALLAAVAGISCALAAILCKESGIAVALLLMVYWFLYRRREARVPWLLFLGGALAITVAVLAAIFLFAVSRQMKLQYLGGSFGQVFLIQPQLWVFMMGQLLWPTNLSADYTLADMDLPSAPVALGVLFSVWGLQAWLALRSRIGALGVAIYWLGLVTVSNFLPLFCILADRFYYLSLAGFAMQLAAAFLLLLRFRRSYALAVGASLLTIPFLAFLTVQREAVFSGEIPLWTDTLQKSPHSCLAYADYGLALFQLGRLDEAADKFESALAIDPDDSSAHVCIGYIDVRKGQIDQAISEFRWALEINPRNGDAHGNLGIALCQQGQLDQGIDEFHQALAIDSNDVSARTGLGLALVQQGDIEAALREFRRALDADPDSVQAHYELGNTLARNGQPDLAAEQFREVLQLKPDHFEARTNLGVIEMHGGKFDAAIGDFRAALKFEPDSPDLHDNLGVALAQKGDLTAAISEFHAALRLKPNFESARTNLARAQAAMSK